MNKITEADVGLGLLDFLNGKVKEAVLNLPNELVCMHEVELQRLARPTPTDYSLRVSFWREYEDMITNNRTRITPARVFRGICSEAYFYNKFIKTEKKVAWLIKPIQEYSREIEAILFRGTQRLWQIMDMDIEDPKTKKIDPRRASVLLETIKMVENRAKGMAVQRSIQKSQVTKLSETPRPQAIPVTNIVEQTKALELKVKEVITVEDSLEFEADDGRTEVTGSSE